MSSSWVTKTMTLFRFSIPFEYYAKALIKQYQLINTSYVSFGTVSYSNRKKKEIFSNIEEARTYLEETPVFLEKARALIRTPLLPKTISEGRKQLY